MSSNFMLLKMYIEDDQLREKYIQYANSKVNKNYLAKYPDAGVDLFIPKDVIIKPNNTEKVDMKIKCAAFINDYPTSFYMYPRSSIGKTKLRLANSVGIIDAGYRGELAGMFDNIGNDVEFVPTNTRLLQICAPNLMPIKLEIVGSLDVLGDTERGEGGFGSTGGTI